jgi:hypothetical protein
MGRIRTVKPELFTHEGLFEAEDRCQLPLRLVFIGLFTCCDRAGRFRWQPRRLKLDILPYDSVDMAAILDGLAEAGFIIAYKVKEVVYGYIPTWSTHQRPNNKESKSQLPDIELGIVLKPPIDPHLSNREGHASVTRATPVNHVNDTGASPVHLTVSLDENSLNSGKINQIHHSGYVIATRTSREENATFFALSQNKGKGKGKGRERELEKEAYGKEKTKQPMSDLVAEIFRFWQRVMDYPKAVLDSTRRKYIQAALAMGYDSAALCQAIQGCASTPYNMGQNDRGEPYDGLHIIFKSADQIDRFIRNAVKPPRPLGKSEQRLQNNIAAAEAWLNQNDEGEGNGVE